MFIWTFQKLYAIRDKEHNSKLTSCIISSIECVTGITNLLSEVSEAISEAPAIIHRSVSFTTCNYVIGHTKWQDPSQLSSNKALYIHNFHERIQWLPNSFCSYTMHLEIAWGVHLQTLTTIQSWSRHKANCKSTVSLYFRQWHRYGMQVLESF